MSDVELMVTCERCNARIDVHHEATPPPISVECPNGCPQGALDYDGLDWLSDGEAVEVVTCSKCGHQWRDFWVLARQEASGGEEE